MRATLLVAWLMWSGFVSFFANGQATPDTAGLRKKDPRSNSKLIVRLHSLGQFSYGGRIVTDNPVLDFNFTYDRKNWGLQVFKAQDLKDGRTPMNFALAVLNKNFRLGKRLTITPSAGVILEQCSAVIDHGSDAALIVTTSYKVSREITLDQSMLFANLVFEPELCDWVNRFRFLYSKKHIDVVLSGWYNNRAFDNSDYVTASASVSYSRIKLSRSLSLNAGLTGLVVANSSDTAINPTKNGVYATLAAVID